MQSETAALAILIPVYQDPAGVTASLHSLRCATWPAPGVVILVDDGSEPPLRVDPGQWSPMPIHVERLPRNAGIEAALNAGLQVARNLGVSYVARLDAGDTIAKLRLCKQFAALEAQREVGVVGSDVDFVGEDDILLFRFMAPQSDTEIRRGMHVNCCLLHPAVMIRMSVIDTVGPYSTNYRAAEDYELFFRILGVSQALCIPESLTRKVVAKQSISITRRRIQLRSRLRVQIRYFDAGCLHSFLGVAMTLVLFAIPNRLLLALKTRIKRVGY